MKPQDLQISTLGPCQYSSPLAPHLPDSRPFIEEEQRIRYRIELKTDNQELENLFFEKAGPRQKLFFDPSQTTAAVVTCGGVSPGLNNVIRSLVLELKNNYRIKRVLGFHYGYGGFLPTSAHPPTALNVREVVEIHKLGGTILGSSRGPVDPSIIVDQLVKHNIDILFCVGGDGTQRGAHHIVEELSKRNLPKSVIGIPKTIDNDVPFVYLSFGFATAVEEACRIIQRAAVESRAFENTVSIVKLMGRDAGFIAANSAVAAQEVDFVLIPEVPFQLDGKHGLVSEVEKKLREKSSLVIVVSEGAGQDYFKEVPDSFDASGNRKQHDIGMFLRNTLENRMIQVGIKANFRYFNPGYSIRSVPANVSDSYYCDLLARAAVHAGMAGKTDMLVGLWYNNLTHVPLPLVSAHRKRILPTQSLWRNVLMSTGQPEHFR